MTQANGATGANTLETEDTEEGSIAVGYPIPPLSKWCGLERFNPESDEWHQLEVPNLGAWWRPNKAHPVKVAEELWEARFLDDGTYRAIFKPEDRRKRGTTGETFELIDESDDDDQGEDEPDELDELDDQPDDEQTAQPRGASSNQPGSGFPGANPPPRRSRRAKLPTVPTRQRPTRTEARSRLGAPPHVHAALELAAMKRDAPPMSQVLLLYDMMEKQRARDVEQARLFAEIFIARTQADADRSIAAERERSNQMLAFVKATENARRSAELGPIQQALNDLRGELGDVRAEQQQTAADAEEQIQQQLAIVAQQPEGPQAIVAAIGQFLQSPAGQLLGEGFKRMLSGDAPPQPQPEIGGYDPAG